MSYSITVRELDEANARYAEMQSELAEAERIAQDASAAAWNQSGTDQGLFRRAHDLGRNAATVRARLNSLAAFLQSADVEPDPDPTPAPTLAARVRASDSGTAGMVRAFTARRGGVCRICQEPIMPGQRIVSWMAAGCYAHASEAADVMARSEAESRARRNDRELAAMYVAFIDRLPIAA